MSTQTFEEMVQEFQAFVRRMKQLEEATNLIFWDMRTGAPKKGLGQRAEVAGMLSTDLFKMAISEEMGAFLAELSTPEALEKLDAVTAASVKERKKEYDRNKLIPPDKYQAFVVLTSNAESAWGEAKANNDFESFRPFLEQIVQTLGEFIEIWGYEGDKYNTLLDQFEPGLTVEKLDAIFAPLRERTVQMVKQIAQKEQTPDLFAGKTFDIAQQRALSEYLLGEIGYDFGAGRLDVTAHPFEISLNPGDVRVTTRFDQDDLNYALFSSIHEGGHALYEQNISTDLINTFLCAGTSMGIHESQSRFWENIVGRSHEFWEYHFEKLTSFFPEQFANVSLDEFYHYVNRVQPSLIRTEADELTYNLHVMIRYEIEKDLINGRIEVKDLPSVWNQKMQDYLGVQPDSDATGVLQDIHWAGGAFGYFPSYSLGNIYSAQLEHVLQQEIPDYKEQIRAGNTAQVKDWLTDKVYRHGKAKTPGEIMTAATGEEINADYLVAYLEEKYKKVYGI